MDRWKKSQGRWHWVSQLRGWWEGVRQESDRGHGTGDDRWGLPRADLAAGSLIKCARKQVNSLFAHLVGERPAQG